MPCLVRWGEYNNRHMKKIPPWAVYSLLPLIILLSAVFLNWKSISYYPLVKVLQFYADRAHVTIDIGAVHGNPFYHTTLENIVIRAEEEQPQTYHFKARVLSCSYNLWDLKEGLTPFMQGLNCSAADPVFAYDFRLTPPQDQPAEKSVEEYIPAFLPGLTLHNGTVVLATAGWVADMRAIDSTLVSAADGARELQLQVGKFQLEEDGVTRIDTGLTSLLRYKAGKLTIASLEMGKPEISASGFMDLGLGDQGVAGFAADLVFGQSRLNLAGSVEDHLLKVHLRTDGLDSADLQQRLGGAGWDIFGKIQGEADLAYGLGIKPDLNGSFTLGVRMGMVHGVGVESLSLAGSLDNDSITVASAEARTPHNHVLFTGVSIPIALLRQDGPLSIIGGSEAEFEVDVADFSELLRLGKVARDVIPENIRPETLTIRGTLEKGAVRLQEVNVVTAESRLTLDGAVIPVPATLQAFASVPIELTARLESSNVPSLTGLFADIPLSGRATALLSITGSMQEPRGEISVAGANLGYHELELGSLALQGNVQLVQEKFGAIRSLKFTVTGLTQTNNSGTLALLSPITGTWQPGRFSMDGAVQIDGQGEAAVRVAKSPGRETAAELSVSNLDSEGWLGNFMVKEYFFHGADFKAVLTGPPENRQLQLAGSIEETGGAGMNFPLAGDFRLKYSSGGIEISEFAWRSHGRNEFTVKGFLPYDPLSPEPFLDGELALDGHMDFPSLEDIAIFLEPLGISRGSVVLDAELSGTWQQPSGHILLKAEGIAVPDILKQYTDSPMDLACDLTAKKGVISMNSVSLASRDYVVQASGSWQHGSSVKELLQKDWGEPGGDIAVDAVADLRNLNFLQKKFPWLRRFDGDVQVKLHAAGPAADPSLTGSFSLQDGEISHTLNFPMLSMVNLQGEFNQHSITLNTMQAEVGGSPVNVSGIITKVKETVAVNLEAKGKNLLLFRNNDMQMRGDVQLIISGPLEHLAINGTTGLTGGYYTRNIDFLSKFGSSAEPVSEGVDFLFSFSDLPLKNAVFHIRITTVEPFRIRNNLLRGILRPELTLKGTGELPYLVGTIYIDPSRVLLPSGRLQVQSGLVRFLESKPDRPQLDLLAQSTVLGYDINVVVRGPLDDPVITLSSSPALPNDELLLLLLTGQPPQQDVAGGARSSGATNVMVYLGRDFLNKWLEDESVSGDNSILDRFELDYGRGVTRSGEQTVEASFRLSELESGKRKVYYLTAEKDKYDAYNYGVKLVFRFE
jgi:hypothetical protein